MRKITVYKVSGLFWTPQRQSIWDCMCSQNFRHKKAAERFMKSLPRGGTDEDGEYREWTPTLNAFQVPRNLKNKKIDWDWYY